MILTVTLNPSMDYLYTIDKFKIGAQNRFPTPTKMVGGKGINAGRTAQILGAEVLTANVLAGENGSAVKKILETEAFDSVYFTVAGETRNAITIMHDEHVQTELVEFGPVIDSQTADYLLAEIIDYCQRHPHVSVISLSGSANSTNEELYLEFVASIQREIPRDIKIITDISGKQLLNLLNSPNVPYLIKPNIHEFSELVGVPLIHKSDIRPYLNNFKLKDIPLIIVSCGSEGAIVKYHQHIYDLTIPQINPVNPTGSGDATVGGAAYALDKDLPIELVLKYAMACGVANAMEEAVGFVQRKNVIALMEQVKLKVIN